MYVKIEHITVIYLSSMFVVVGEVGGRGRNLSRGAYSFTISSVNDSPFLTWKHIFDFKSRFS